MPKFLRTSSITANLEELIIEAKEKVYIISPYLKLTNPIKERLQDKEREKVDVRIIFGKEELNASELRFLQSLKYVKLYFYKNLHAKCYLNERKMIITSMNLYEFSIQNNREMGVLFDNSDEIDKGVYNEAWTDIVSIMNNSEDFAYSEFRNVAEPIKAVKKAVPIKETKSAQNNMPTGYCIRTGQQIPFNIEKPLCPTAFKSWSKFGDEDYAEKFCHFSGESSEGKTSVSKPILKKNWRKAREVFG